MNLRKFAGGRSAPATLPAWVLTLRVLAWPVTLGAAIGLGMAISLFALHHFSPLKSREKAGQDQVFSPEGQS